MLQKGRIVSVSQISTYDFYRRPALLRIPNVDLTTNRPLYISNNYLFVQRDKEIGTNIGKRVRKVKSRCANAFPLRDYKEKIQISPNGNLIASPFKRAPFLSLLKPPPAQILKGIFHLKLWGRFDRDLAVNLNEPLNSEKSEQRNDSSSLENSQYRNAHCFI